MGDGPRDARVRDGLMRIAATAAVDEVGAKIKQNGSRSAEARERALTEKHILISMHTNERDHNII